MLLPVLEKLTDERKLQFVYILSFSTVLHWYEKQCLYTLGVIAEASVAQHKINTDRQICWFSEERMLKRDRHMSLEAKLQQRIGRRGSFRRGRKQRHHAFRGLTAGRGTVPPWFVCLLTCRLLADALQSPLHQRGAGTMLARSSARACARDGHYHWRREIARTEHSAALRRLPAVSAPRRSGGAHRGARAGTRTDRGSGLSPPSYHWYCGLPRLASRSQNNPASPHATAPLRQTRFITAILCCAVVKPRFISSKTWLST